MLRQTFRDLCGWDLCGRDHLPTHSYLHFQILWICRHTGSSNVPLMPGWICGCAPRDELCVHQVYLSTCVSQHKRPLTSCLARGTLRHSEQRTYDTQVCKRLFPQMCLNLFHSSLVSILYCWGCPDLVAYTQRMLPASFRLSWKFLPCKKKCLAKECWKISSVGLCRNCLFLKIWEGHFPSFCSAL